MNGTKSGVVEIGSTTDFAEAASQKQARMPIRHQQADSKCLREAGMEKLDSPGNHQPHASQQPYPFC
ncbi:hypothetical protein [Rhizobium mesoamericanum]|uniref:hypothetical protein n=1 Tax=Rhizobium mesoamericanum TaxID=1079800 RepID=UPI0012FAD1A5|nr:hypothetical protein [Rhizobium mesoamericanum]